MCAQAGMAAQQWRTRPQCMPCTHRNLGVKEGSQRIPHAPGHVRQEQHVSAVVQNLGQVLWRLLVSGVRVELGVLTADCAIACMEHRDCLSNSPQFLNQCCHAVWQQHQCTPIILTSLPSARLSRAPLSAHVPYKLIGSAGSWSCPLAKHGRAQPRGMTNQRHGTAGVLLLTSGKAH